MKRPLIALLGILAVGSVAISLIGCKTKHPPEDSTNVPTTAPAAGKTVAKIAEPPPAPREFRGVWVATVGNIDWPTKPGESTAQQQAEAIAILDKCAELNINAVIFQVRPACDALYQSDIEPWSYYLTGAQGKPPTPFYDPLKFWIDEAHKRGIELHAWFNPFRAHVNESEKSFAPNHIVKTNPAIVKDYREYLWLDPGAQAAQDRTFDVFMDVVKRYDVDGIHIDDYFYPYKVKLNPKDKTDKRELAFPDDDTYAAYQQSGGKLARDDWRRDNIDRIVHRIYNGAKATKPWVKFGISPFGIGHNRPSVVKGFDPYNEIYCNSELWLHNGWCDYFTPQLYWRISATSQPFMSLLDFWIANNAHHRNIYPGLYTAKVGVVPEDDTPSTAPSSKPATEQAREDRRKKRDIWDVHEILDQIQVARNTPGAGGVVHFSMKCLMDENRGIGEAFKDGPYKDAALVPSSPWLDTRAPAKPHLTVGSAGNALHATLSAGSAESPWLWAVYVKQGDTWKFHVYPAQTTTAEFPADKDAATAVCVSAIDRCGVESQRVIASVK